MKIRIPSWHIALLVLSMTSIGCQSTQKVRTNTINEVRVSKVSNQDVAVIPVMADLDIEQERRSVTTESLNGPLVSLDFLKKQASGKLLIQNKADVLLDPTFTITTTKKLIRVEVKGYLARYRNFRNAVPKDFEYGRTPVKLVKSKSVMRASTSEIKSGPTGPSQNQLVAVLARAGCVDSGDAKCDELEGGLAVGLSYARLINPNVGLGIDFDHSSFSLEERIESSNIGLFATGHYFFETTQKWKLDASLGLGLSSYYTTNSVNPSATSVTELELNTTNTTFTAYKLGVAGYYPLSDNISAGIKLDYIVHGAGDQRTEFGEGGSPDPLEAEDIDAPSILRLGVGLLLNY